LQTVIDDIGLWCEFGEGDFAARPALFLDRDGVIIADTNYLARPQDLRMIEGAAAAIARCNTCGIPVVVVTNQSGIARRYYGWDDFRAVQGALTAALASLGAHLDAVLACGYHGEGHEPLRIADHPWRKPNPGMIRAAERRMSLDLPRSWIVGDRPGDVAAGAAAGLAGGTLVASDEQMRREVALLASERFIVNRATNLSAAVAALFESGQLAGPAHFGAFLKAT
jgi:D-glycero-D-manno-heptose 1,7-bisphosphate phosphatase